MDLLSKKCRDCWFRNDNTYRVCRACKWPVGCGRVDYYFKDPELHDGQSLVSSKIMNEGLLKVVCRSLQTCCGCLNESVFIGNECLKCYDYSHFKASPYILKTINEEWSKQ